MDSHCSNSGRIILTSVLALGMMSFLILTMYKTRQIEDGLQVLRLLGKETVLNSTDINPKQFLAISSKPNFPMSPFENSQYQFLPNVSQSKLKKKRADAEPLPWICETTYEWKDLGANYYPRFIRTAECKTKFCVQGFFQCQPKNYKTRILKRTLPDDQNLDVDNDEVVLPEPLQSNWKLVTINVQLCCECTGIRRVS
ncbi:unnamed protein product [Allacma fusca]|uniref:Uncharacterized protein n=1 Tax=Allacma fusca TaxID=39272 RepID=A0A8J2P1D6_9HEXA|nr:unnamed protein product [Allacma fusca]